MNRMLEVYVSIQRHVILIQLWLVECYFGVPSGSRDGRLQARWLWVPMGPYTIGALDGRPSGSSLERGSYCLPEDAATHIRIVPGSRDTILLAPLAVSRVLTQ